jgi:hypothetical protein
MPKAPSIDTFKITCEVAVHNLGPAMVRLAQIEGLIVTGSELVTTVKSFTQNARTTHHIKAEGYLEQWLKDHPTFRAAEAVRHFKADGRTSGACYTALRVMSADGRLRKLGDGMYQRPDIKALAKPKKEKEGPLTRTHKEVPGPEFALRLMRRSHGKMSSATLKKHFDEDGRAGSGVSGVIQKLLKGKHIKRIDEGLYQLTPKKTDKPKLNGPVPAEVSANG